MLLLAVGLGVLVEEEFTTVAGLIDAGLVLLVASPLVRPVVLTGVAWLLDAWLPTILVGIDRVFEFLARRQYPRGTAQRRFVFDRPSLSGRWKFLALGAIFACLSGITVHSVHVVQHPERIPDDTHTAWR